MSNASTSLTISTNAAPDAYSASGGASPLRRSSFASLFRRLRVSGSTLAAAAAGLFFLPPPPLLCFIPDSGPSLSNRIRRRSFTLASYAAPTSASARALDATASIRSGSSRSVATAFTQGGAVASGTQSQNGAYGFTSSTGVPSTRSAPPSVSVLASTSTAITRAMERPTGSGRCGVRVASAPTGSPFSRGTRTFAFTLCP
mmetsp:Transcript_8959/g.32804  ORF Transcript_8959/g.32804 Transcript_8959/m.32804 type:complete len:201 (-) Transcript_8959:80-682(-)